MPQLLFKRQFIDAILRGDKTTTLRRWRSSRVHPGSRAKVPGVGWVKILSCERIVLADLTAADAKADGFGSLKELFDTVKRFYPDHETDGRHWYRVEFRCEAPETPPATVKTASSGKSAVPAMNRNARRRLARRIRADLDKAVRQSGSLFPI